MLVRHIQESGGRIYGNKRIHGRRELRDVFIGAAENAMRTKTTLRDHYDALRVRGVNHKDAKVNLARQISAISLSCLKNSETYQDDYRERFKQRKRVRQMLSQ